MCGGEETSESPKTPWYGKAAHSRWPNIRFLDRRTVETVGFRQLNKFTIYKLTLLLLLFSCHQNLSDRTEEYKSLAQARIKNRAEPQRPQRLRGGGKLAIRPMAIRICMEKTEEKRDNSQCFGTSDFVDRRTGETVVTMV